MFGWRKLSQDEKKIKEFRKKQVKNIKAHERLNKNLQTQLTLMTNKYLKENETAIKFIEKQLRLMNR